MDIRWIKLSVNMFDDEKIRIIRTMPDGDKIILIWIQLLCLAGKINDGGEVYVGQRVVYTDDMLATILGCHVTLVRTAVKTFESFGMIEIDESGKISISNWEKHQNIDALEELRARDNERQKKARLRKRIKALGYDPMAPGVPNDLPNLEEYYKQLNRVT